MGAAAAGQSAPTGSLLPKESPRAMPEQAFWGEPRASRTPRHVRAARLALVLLWLLACGGFAWTLYRVLSVETPTLLQLVFLGFSTLCFAWVAVGSASALVGFVWLLLRRTTDTLELPAARPARRRQHGCGHGRPDGARDCGGKRR